MNASVRAGARSAFVFVFCCRTSSLCHGSPFPLQYKLLHISCSVRMKHWDKD